MFSRAIDALRTHGTGGYRKDLPKALKAVASSCEEEGGITPLHGLVLGAAARRLDEIGEEPLAAELRAFRHKEGG